MNRLFRWLAVGFLFLPFSITAQGQGIPTIGSASTFEAATWNIEWFGSDNNGPNNEPLQFANVLNIIRSADIDFWAVQEITSDEDFDALLDSLGSPYNGVLATESTSQKIGFVYNEDVVSIRGTPAHILTSFNFEFAFRPPLELEADITVDGTTRRVTFITVHMKAFSDGASYDRRQAAAGRLKNHIDFTSHASEMVVIMGDFNDELTRSITSGRQSPYKNFLDDSDNYFFPTLELDEAGRNTFCFSSGCSSGSTIDHILVSGEVVPLYQENSADHFIELISSVTGYTSSTSDHLPTFAIFDLSATATVVENPGPRDSEFLVFPNPATDRLTMSVGDVSGPSVIDVYDLLGRKQLTTTVGAADGDQVSIDISRLASGRYLARITDDHGRVRSSVVVKQ